MGISHLLAALLATGAADTAGQSMELLVPAYFYPTSWTASTYYWDDLRTAAQSGVPMTVIMNPANGHEPEDPVYLDEFRLLKDAKHMESGRSASVIAYVSTCWATQPCNPKARPAVPGTEDFQTALTRITGEIDRYATFYETKGYTLQGVFLDEMSRDESSLPLYEQIHAHVRAKHQGWKIFANPGMSPNSAPLEATADVLVTFEGTKSMYFSGAPGSAAPASSQAHMITNTYTADEMTEVLNRARMFGNAGYIYITDQYQPTDLDQDGKPDEPRPADQTDDNPYNQLPSYWSEELTAVK